MNSLPIIVYKLDESAKLPTQGSADSACFDMYSCFWQATCNSVSPTPLFSTDNVPYTTPLSVKQLRATGEKYIIIPPFHRVLVPTGLKFDIIKGYSLRLFPRSGMAFKTGLTLCNSVGVIDSDYTQEVFVALVNLNSGYSVTVENLQRICQCEIIKNEPIKWIQSYSNIEQKTDRAGGFGSTGTA